MLGKVCTKPVVTAPPTMSVAEAARIMRAKNVGTVVVVNAGQPIGLLTDRDILVDVLAQGKHADAVPVSEVMRKEPVVIGAEEGIFDAAKLFAKTGVRRLPVVAKDGKLLGIITMDDVLMLLGNEMGHIASALSAELRSAA
ncbi:MAG: CBS domain-containing protein [Candidatus Rokubacteria bacterium]|nr:CBS domain-containing protein [Candidatus Rokubacteria bacterium]